MSFLAPLIFSPKSSMRPVSVSGSNARVLPSSDVSAGFGSGTVFVATGSFFGGISSSAMSTRSPTALGVKRSSTSCGGAGVCVLARRRGGGGGAGSPVRPLNRSWSNSYLLRLRTFGPGFGRGARSGMSGKSERGWKRAFGMDDWIDASSSAVASFFLRTTLMPRVRRRWASVSGKGDGTTTPATSSREMTRSGLASKNGTGRSSIVCMLSTTSSTSHSSGALP